MNNIIKIKVDGYMSLEDMRRYREQLLKDIKEGLLVVDDRVEEVVLTSIDNLGIKED